MSRSRVLAMACLVILSSGAAQAEAVNAGSATNSATSEPAQQPAIINSGAAAATDASVAADSKPAAVASTESDAETSSEAAKATEPAKPVPPPSPTLTAQIDLAAQKMVVSEDGEVKYSWPISSGTAEFPTPRGTFRAQWTAKMWYSRKYDNAPMPNAVFINGGVAVHATQHVSRLGSPASHGCIRLAPGNAKVFYNLVQRHGLKLTRVSVYGTPKWSAPAVASRDSQRRRIASQDDSGFWFWGPSKYQPTSAYDPGFTPPRYRKPPRNAYVNNLPPRAYYLRPNGQRVYVKTPPRRVYSYSNNGYGYGNW